MGQLPKSVIEQLKRQKREAKAAKKRNIDKKDPYVHFLIVCEGERTEPQYFEELVKNDDYSSVRDVKVTGEGRATCALVKRALEIKQELEVQRMIKFDQVWVVFDKDNFNDFNEAIELARKYGFKVAWSNEAFELWYLLHFIYLDTAISRADYIKKLEAEIRKITGNKDYKYLKNDPSTYNLLQNIGNEQLATRYAQRLRNFFNDSIDYKNHKPCTLVDLLVYELRQPTIK